MSHTGTAGLPEPGRYRPGHSQEGKGSFVPVLDGGLIGGLMFPLNVLASKASTPAAEAAAEAAAGSGNGTVTEAGPAA